MLQGCRKILLFTGGILINLVIFIQVAGCGMIWGTLLPYVASYFYSFDHSVTNADFSIVLFISKLTEGLSNFIVSYLSHRLNLHTIILIYSASGCSLIFFSSFVLSPFLFSCVFGFAVGILSSGIFLPSVWIMWNHIYEDKALSSGIILAGFSGGSIPFSIIFTLIVNPYNRSANETDDGNERMFGDDVAKRVPMTIRWLSICYIILIIIGMMLIPRKTNILSSTPTVTNHIKLKEIIKKKRFWILFFFMLLSMACQQYVLLFYKVVALQYFNDDYYSSFIGMTSFFFATAGRIVFGILLSKFYWKKIMIIVYSVQTLNMVSFWFSLEDKALYAFFLISFLFLCSSFYNNVLILVQNAFPDSKTAISAIYISVVISSLVPYFIDKFITPTVGYLASFLIVAGFFVILLLQSIFYDDSENDTLLGDDSEMD